MTEHSKETPLQDGGWRLLRPSEAVMAAIFNTTVEGVVVIDDQGTILAFNPAAERIFGHLGSEVIGRNVSLLMPSPYQEEHDDYLTRYLSGGRAHVIGIGREVVGKHKEGRVFPLDLSVSEVWDGERRLFTGIIRDSTERKRLEEAVVSVSEAERQMIGQDLHDVLGQQLTGISLLAKALASQLDAADSPAAGAAGDIAELATDAVMEAKRLAHGLYPVELERLGLQAALEQLAENQSRLYEVDCLFKSRGKLPRLGRTVSLHLYRIAQEGVSNAIRHGKAPRILIELEQLDSVVKLGVLDNGSGIPEDLGVCRGMGINIMQYRTSLIGGRLEITRGPEGGTQLSCEFHPGVTTSHHHEED